ncbi:dTDP-4-dehydrorhamnose reductase [Methylomicrobium sp. Wu6]|uniref:dTDP-4-dehydrorhamnose reductase n=1 Tax=Methylomicrobium sp. Wu6 TaxID=3107928 RepID=UPI002DD681B0|nr:dTDP-4-dehydrorhamnose reductase [Methylomicrobium sp. Wu6]MEC4747755.1 dTDP-4-dehydrorhamnose reductase [Methylomicrobium sp. Wu6]
MKVGCGVRKILVTGKSGQVGWELRRSLSTLGEVIGIGSAELDLADADAIRHFIRQLKPDIIVNPAAYTAVDKAESEADLAMAVNAIAPGVLAEEVKRLGALLVHYSTDYVFDGIKREPYVEDDQPNPLNVYGASKLAGEQAIRNAGANHLILRTSWVYGVRGKNFLLTMRRLGRERDELGVVNDQTGAPTWSRAIAECTAQMLAQLYAPGDSADLPTRLSDTYHLTSQGQTTWCGFVKEAVAYGLLDGRDKPLVIKPINTAAYPTPAIRPMYSVMSNAKLFETFGIRMPSWQQSLTMVLEEFGTC